PLNREKPRCHVHERVHTERQSIASSSQGTTRPPPHDREFPHNRRAQRAVRTATSDLPNRVRPSPHPMIASSRTTAQPNAPSVRQPATPPTPAGPPSPPMRTSR